MSGMMLHGLGDCTPELNCGCMAKSPQDELRKRIARALSTGAKRKVTMTDEQRAASAARLRAVRASA